MTLLQAFEFECARLICLCGGGGKTTLMFALAGMFAALGERVLVTTTTRMAEDEVRCGLPLVIDDALDALSADETRPGVTIACRRVEHGKAIGFEPQMIDQVARSGRFDRILVEGDGSARKPLKAPLSHEPVFPADSDVVLIVAGLSGVGRPLDDVAVFRPKVWASLTGLPLGQPVTAESVAAMAIHPEGLARRAPANARRILYLNQTDIDGGDETAAQIAGHLSDNRKSYLDRIVAGRLLPDPSVAILHINSNGDDRGIQ